jgi:hypothetical protein
VRWLSAARTSGTRKGERTITDELFSAIPIRQRGATVTRRVNYSGGWLMPRHAVGRGLRRVLPEFGPADRLEPRTESHDHTWPPGSVKHILGRGHDRVNVDGVHEHDWINRPNHRHDSVDPKVWTRHVGGARSGHNGRRRHGLHQHEMTKKYLFAPKPWVFAAVTQVDHHHGLRSVRKWHPEGDTKAEHQHVAYVKDPENSYAQRLDMHPDTLAVLPTARRVFWSIEGVLKNDALVTAGEAVFDVPSVGQWDAPELEPFARSYLAGKMVYIVPDSDWASNSEVSLQAFAARETLRRVLGRYAVDVAAPTPEPRTCRRHDEPAGAKRGIDDFLADGETVGGLEVLEREVSPQMERWCRRYVEEPRPGTYENGRRRDVAVLWALSILADDEGRVSRRERSIARYLGWSGRRAYEKVQRAIEALLDVNDAPLEEEPSLWDMGLLDTPFECVDATSGDRRFTQAEILAGEETWIETNWKGSWTAAPIITLRSDLRARSRRVRLDGI